MIPTGYADVALPGVDEVLIGDVPLPFGQPEELTPEEEARRLRRALVDVLAHVNGEPAPAFRVRAWRELAGLPAVVDEPATPEDRRDHGIARAAAKWTDEEVAQVDAAIRAIVDRLREQQRATIERTRAANYRVADEAFPQTFTTAAVWAELGDGFPVTKGIAGRMLAARSAGLIRSTGRTTTPPKDAPGPNNGQRLTVWEVLA